MIRSLHYPPGHELPAADERGINVSTHFKKSAGLYLPPSWPTINLIQLLWIFKKACTVLTKTAYILLCRTACHLSNLWELKFSVQILSLEIPTLSRIIHPSPLVLPHVGQSFQTKRRSSFPNTAPVSTPLHYFKVFSISSWLLKVCRPYLAASSALLFSRSLWCCPPVQKSQCLGTHSVFVLVTDLTPETKNFCKMPPTVCRHSSSINIFQPRPQKGVYSSKKPAPWAILKVCQEQPSKTRCRGLGRYRMVVTLVGSVRWENKEKTRKLLKKL